MTKRGLIIASIVGLVAAVVSVLLLNRAAAFEIIDLVYIGLDIVAAAIAGRVILGRPRVHRYFALGMVVLSGIAAALLTAAGSNYLIHTAIAIGRIDYKPTGNTIVEGIAGIVVYLIAATVYGFAGTRQGVKVGGRVGLLLLLLLAVIPALNVLGLIGVTITAFVRGAASPTTTPAPPAASA
jgi:hypothetical protein